MASPKKNCFLIVGCGHFGSRAAQNLLSQHSHSKITVVDKDKRALQKISHLPLETVLRDGRSYLDQVLSTRQPADYIVPAVPFHLAFEYLLAKLGGLGARKGNVPFLPGLPNRVIGNTGDLYTSWADFLCPEDCPEPAQYCTVTRKRRLKPLYRMLSDLRGPFDSMVIRSQQLGRGVGGFQTRALLDVLEKIKRRSTHDFLFLISTACRCHGVTSALSFS